MRAIALIEFADIYFARGAKRLERVNALNAQYDVKRDLYKKVREAIIRVHREKQSKSRLYDVLRGLRHDVKKMHFPKIIYGYRKWWGNKKISWFRPPNNKYSKYGVQISVNPDLGLIINGKSHLIKLYFREDKLTKESINIITNLMDLSLSHKCSEPDSTIMGVLDTRRSKILTSTGPIANLVDKVNAELADISKILKIK